MIAGSLNPHPESRESDPGVLERAGQARRPRRLAIQYGLQLGEIDPDVRGHRRGRRALLEAERPDHAARLGWVAPRCLHRTLMTGKYIQKYPSLCEHSYFERFRSFVEGRGGFAVRKIARATCSGVASSFRTLVSGRPGPRFGCRGRARLPGLRSML